MMRWLVSACTRHFGVVSALSALALVLGCLGALRAQLDVFPDFVPTQVDIQTEAPGFAPEQVEQLVTKPVENAINGAAGLAIMRSESIPGLSVVTVTFEDGVDVHVARQGISERLSELGSTLPAGVGTPKLSPLVSSTMDLLKIGLVSDTADAYALRDAADWVVKPRLLAVPGVTCDRVRRTGTANSAVARYPEALEPQPDVYRSHGCGARRPRVARRRLY